MKLDQQFLVREGNDPKDTKSNAGQRTGVEVPFITINAYPVSSYLKSFNLDLNGFLPVVNFSFYAGNPTFISVNYPKDGDIVSVYMASPDGYYKPLRMDFNILSVRSDVRTSTAHLFHSHQAPGTYGVDP